MEPIPYGRQHVNEDDVQAVVEVLTSELLTQGPAIAQFEKEFASYVGSDFAVAVSSGTAALHLCALAINVKPGDKVITTPITFVASANCVRYCGGEVIFADIDPDTYLLDINSVEKLINESPEGTYKGIIPVDFAGRAVDMEAFRNLADEHNLWIIEDSCHSPGGYFIDSKGKRQTCGSGNFADLAIFSFHPVKHIACGEGGMVTTNDEELYKQLIRLRSHGITKGDDPYINQVEFASGLADAEHYPSWYMEMQQLGYNYRLSEIHAALGLSQLKRADEGSNNRKKIAKKYNNVFSDAHYILGHSGFIEGHAYHLYVIEVEDRLGLYNYLKANNVFAQIHYIPAHLMPYYRNLGWKEGDFNHAESYYKKCISLPIFASLSNYQQDYVIEIIKKYYK